MSRVEEGNLFVRQFTRVALALSVVTSGFVLADQNINANVDITDYLSNGETNTTIASAIDSDGVDSNVTVNSGVDVSGSIIAGELRGSGLPIPAGQTDTFTYFSGHDSRGTVIGLDINSSILELTNLGSIGVTAHTLESYTESDGSLRYPDQNNTTLVAVGIEVGATIDSLNNSGVISATATLNNDTNNSVAVAIGIAVIDVINKGIVNTGTITATASTHDAIYDVNGDFVENRLVASIGGHDGNGAQEVRTEELGETARYTSDLLHDQTDAKVGSDSTMVVSNNNLVDFETEQRNTRMVSDTRRYDERLLDRKDGENKHHDNYADQSLDTDNRSDYNDQFHIVDSTGQHQKDRMQEKNFIRTDNGGDNNSHMHRGTFTPDNLGSPGDLNNIIFASGITVDDAVTGGITNYNYISSVIIGDTVDGSAADGSAVGITVTPNTGALAGATYTAPNPVPDPDDTNTTAPDPVDPAPVSGLGATGSAGGATFAVPAADNGTLPDDNNYSAVALAEAELDVKTRIKVKEDAIDALAPLAADADDAAVQARKNEVADLKAEIATIQDAVDSDAIKADIAQAYAIKPDIEAEIASQKAAAVTAPASPPIAAAGEAPTDGFKDGVHTARIGNTILNAAITGDPAQGILVRASSSTNIADEINATTGALSASDGQNGNRNTNANVTSGTVSAYLGEGVRDNMSRVITIDKNSTKRAINSNVATDYNRLTNDLIGGLENNSEVLGGAGAAGMTLTSDAIADANRTDGIAVNQYGVTNDGTTTYYDIVSNPTSIVGVGTLMNTGTITGGAGGAGLEVLATSTGKIRTDANITGHELIVSPTSITNVREVINHGDIVGGMGGNAINGKAVAVGSITATDINLTAGGTLQTDGLTVKTHADATMGNFFSSGIVGQSLGEDGMKMEADGSAKLEANTITDSIVNIDTTSTGGVRKVYGKDGDNTKRTEGNLLNAGEISVSLSANAVNMHAEGLATLTDKAGAENTTVIKNSNITVRNETITGVEGNFVNVAWADTNETSLEKSAVKRGKITAALAADAIHLDANGVASLQPLSIEGGRTDIKNISTSGVGETFANYGEVSVALSANAVNFSSVGTATLGLKTATTITAGVTTVTNISTSGVRGDFINGASAIETGTLNEANTTVHNPLYTPTAGAEPELIKSRDGYYEVAAMINENNTSDTNSSGTHTNDANNIVVNGQSSDGYLNQLTQVVVHSYDKETAITSGKITSALATDAVKFDSTATGDLKVVKIGASTLERIDLLDGDAHHDVFSTKAIVTSISISDSSIGGDFINNGEISVALAADGINGKSTATGTLGSSGDNNEVEASVVTQYAASRSGVQGDFINEAVSREVGSAVVFTAQSGSEEVGAFTYGRLTNQGEVKITAALAANAVQLESHATNLIDLKESNAAAFVHDSIGSGVTNGSQARNLAGWKAIAGATRSELNSTTTSISGVGENFSNTGTISAALAANGFDALAVGNNDLGKTGFPGIKGTNVTSHMSSIAGVQGDFTNDIQSLKKGDATLVQRDVYNIDQSNAQISPKYYDNEDGEEGKRVKSNVVDRVVYDRELAKGEITAALAADAIILDATGTTNILADKIGTSNVEVVTNHTGYATANENNETKVEVIGLSDLDRTIKVTSEDVKVTSTVIAGIGGQFTNRNIISSALAANALTAMGTATTLLGKTAITEIEGGNVLASTLVIAGIGNDFNVENHEGFLNAAGTYDEGDVEVGQSKVIAGENNQAHLILDENSNDVIASDDTHLNLIDSHDVVFWNRQAPIVGEMSTALAADVVKVDGVNAGSVVPGLITAAMGDVNVTVDGVSSMVAVVGEHVEGTARATVTETSTVIAGINGGLTNEGKMTAALAGNVLMAQADGTGIVGDATAEIKGSTVLQNTTTYAGVQDGDFVNEALSFETDAGVVVTTLDGNKETPTVVFDRATTDGSVEMSVALSATVAQMEALSTNKVEAVKIEASSGVKYGGGATTWEIGAILASAKTVTSDVNSSTTSVAGVSGNFYNSGKIDMALSADGIDALADAKNAIGTRVDENILGSNVIASSTAISGIRGDFTNDVVTLDDGAKYIVKRDVVDANGNPVYDLSADTAPGERVKSNVVLNDVDDKHHETNAGHGIVQHNNTVDGIATDGAVYGQKIAEGEIGAALSADAVKLDATGLNEIKAARIAEAEVAVVGMDVQTGTLSNNEIHPTANRTLTVDVTSDTEATVNVVAGISGSFINRSSKEIKVALSKNAITAVSDATTTWGGAGVTTVQGGTHIANTKVVAGIGNGNNEHDGFANLADSYNLGINTGVTTQVASNNVAGHALNADNANDAVATDENLSLPLIDSAEVVYWDNKIIVGKITASLSKDTLNLESKSTGSITPGKAYAVTNDVNVSDISTAVAGYHVTGSSVGANITKVTTSIAGISGGFLNEGEISTSLSGNVVNTRGTATGTVGKVGVTAVVGSTLDGTTVSIAGIQDGDFNNTVKSLATTANPATEVVTVLDANGIETPKVVFARETTDGKVKLEASLSKDVVLLDVSAINLVDGASIDASEYVMSTAGGSTLAAAKSGMSNVTGRSIAIGGVEGDFYNTGIIEAKLSLNAITTHGTSDNDLGSGALNVHGSNVTATSLAYARIAGDFINDAVLLDENAPLITYDTTTEGNTSNVAGSVTYDQALVKGLVKAGLSKDVLSLVATGNNEINLGDVKNTAVKVVNIFSNDLDADANHTVSDDQLISSNIKAGNTAHSGIGGIFINAGTMETALGTDVVNMQAVGGPAIITVGALGGGTVEGNNTVLSGINLAATSTKKFGDIINDKKYTTILPAGFDLSSKKDDIVGFLNDKRDFNTLLESDTTSVTLHTTPITGHTDDLVATGEIKADLAQVTVNMLATGGVTNTITADTGKIYTTDVDANNPYGTATVNNTGTNTVVIQGDFVNLGDIKTGTAGHVLNMIATNEATTVLGTLTADTGGLVMSTATSTVSSYIAGDIVNTGEMSSGTAGNVIAMEALGGVSAITVTMADHNLTDWAANNGKVVATNDVTTKAGVNNIFNSGLIKSGAAGVGIKLNAKGAADSSAFTNNASNTALAGNAIVVNRVDSNVSVANLTNIGTIHSVGANAMEIHATGSAKRATNVADVNASSYEITTARVNASVADIKNSAYTRQNALWEVNKIFNTDNNDTTDDQLRPTEDIVVRNLGEYDLTTGAKIDSNESTYSTEAELDRLAYGDAIDVNTSAPILSQTIGVIKSDAANAIDIVAVATESNTTLVTATMGHILNSGSIDASAAGIGINISADGVADPDDEVNKGAKAVATVGVIANYVIDDTFKIGDLAVLGGLVQKPAKDDVVHAILEGEILGLTAGIKIDAVDADDKDVSVATVEQIVNYRRVLNQGDFVISSAGADDVSGVNEAVADGKVANNGSEFATVNATRVTQNYGITQLNVDGVYNAVIGDPTLAGASIIVGENAHVTKGILNYGELKGKVSIGDATLHLYGLVQNADHNETFGARPETDEMGLTDNYFAVKSDVNNSAYVDEEDHIQVAGMITTATPTKVDAAIVGSEIYFDNSHILDTADATYNADHIILPTGSIVNIDENTEFITEASNPFDVNLSEGIHNMMTNNSYLNVRAGITATVTGNYEQKGGYFVTNVDVASTPAGATTAHSAAGGTTFGQLDVSGNADLTGGILVMLDDLDTDLTPASTAVETRLVDVVKSANFTVGSDKNMTHAGANYDALTAKGAGDANASKVIVQDNTRVFDFEAVAGTTAGDISLRIVTQDPNAAPISIDTTNVAVSAIATTTRVVASRIDNRPTFNFRGTPTRVVHFTSTEDSPIFIPTTEATVGLPAGTTNTGGSGTTGGTGSTGSTGGTGTVEPRPDNGGQQEDGSRPSITVLSQAGQTGSHGELVLNTTSAVNSAGGAVKPSLGNYEVSKNLELEQLRNENFNVWGKIFASSAEQDGEDGTSNNGGQNKTTQVQLGRAGYSSTTYGLVAGADKQYGEWFLGTAVALAKSTADTNSGPATSTETTMFQVTEYGSHEAGKGRVNFQAGFAYLTNDKDRTDGTIGDGLGSDGKVYNSDYNGYALNAGVEYEQGFALNSDVTLIPYAGLTGTYVNNDGYTETGGDNAQEVSSADSSALIVGVGTRATYKLSENSALLGNVGVGYDMIAERVDYEARTALNANSETLHIEGAKPEELEYEVGVGYQFVTPKNTVIRANVDYRARDGYEDTTGSVKFYFPF